MIGVKWEGPDGSLWDLRDGSSGVQISQGGVLGLRHPPSQTFTRESSFVDGQQVTGWRLRPRALELPLDVHGLTEEDWFVRDRAISRAFRVDRPGKLTIVDPLGGRRSISARLDDTDDDAIEDDPASTYASTIVMPLIADDPWYYGQSLEHVFRYSNPDRGFYPPSGYGPPFYLAPATFTGADTVYNPGDAPAWGTLTLPGPAEGFLVDLGGRVISGFVDGFTLGENDVMTIDTDPRRSSAKLADGTNVTRYLTSTQFAAVPDGSSVPISVIVYGATEMRLTLVPRYLRAW